MTDNREKAGIGLEGTTVFFLGASNVSMEAAALADYMGFETAVVDEDAALTSEARFPHSRRIVVDDMADLGDPASDFGIGGDDMVCVITRGHTYDRQGFAWALGTAAFYVGMMGSAKKNAKCFQYALEQGIAQERIDWAHAPIGIDMECSDAREIALSIVTELVKCRNEHIHRELDHDLLHQE